MHMKVALPSLSKLVVVATRLAMAECQTPESQLLNYASVVVMFTSSSFVCAPIKLVLTLLGLAKESS